MSGSEPTPPGAVVELRPEFSLDWLSRRHVLAVGAGIALGAVALVLRAGSVLGSAIAVGVFLAAVRGCLGGIIIHYRTARLVLGPSWIEQRGLLVRGHRLSTVSSSGVLALLAQPLSTPIEFLVVTGTAEDGRSRVMRLTGAVWAPDQLCTAARHAGVGVAPGILSAMELERLAPGTVPMPFRRPWLFASAVAMVVVLAVIAGYVLLT